LLLLQLRKKEKDKLTFSIEDRALVVLYEDTVVSSQTELYESTLEDRLINTLDRTLKDVDQYLTHRKNGDAEAAKNYNLDKKSKPAKMQAILSKLASEKVILLTDSGLELCIHKTEIHGCETEKPSVNAINCSINKPELIKNLNAEFHCIVNEKKYVATLDIAADLEEEVLRCALERLKVDITFHSVENINVSNQCKGRLASIKEAEQQILETVTEDLF